MRRRALSQINGAGATFPYPIYSKWFSDYNKLHPNVRINYQSIGSGGGIRQLIEQTVFFGATDQPMTDEMIAKAPGPVLHFPDRARRRRAGVQPRGRRHARSSSPVQFSRTSSSARSRNGTTPRSAKINPGVKLPSTRDYGRPSLGRFGHHVRLGRLPRRRSRRSGKRRSARARRSTGRSASAARATKASPGSSSRRPRRSATSSSSTPCKTRSPTAPYRTRPASSSSRM